MHDREGSVELSTKSMLWRFFIMIAVSGGAGVLGCVSGALEMHQATACGVFLAIIFGTLFFWNFRLAIAFLGLSVLIFTNSLNIARFVTSSSLEVILFLVGMMIIVGSTAGSGVLHLGGAADRFNAENIRAQIHRLYRVRLGAAGLRGG